MLGIREDIIGTSGFLAQVDHYQKKEMMI